LNLVGKKKQSKSTLALAGASGGLIEFKRTSLNPPIMASNCGWKGALLL